MSRRSLSRRYVGGAAPGGAPAEILGVLAATEADDTPVATGTVYSPADDLPGITLWLRGDLGVTLSGSDVATWADQSGAGNDFLELTNRPTFTSSVTALGSRPGVTFNGSNDVLSTSGTIATMLGAGGNDWFMCIAFVASSIATNNATVFLNDSLFVDSGAFWGTHLKSAGSANAYVWDGGAKSDAQTIAAGTGYVFSAKHVGGTLYTKLNNGSWSAGTTAGAISVTGGFLRLGWAVTVAFTGSIAEVVTATAAPSDAKTAECAAYMVARYGL